MTASHASLQSGQSEKRFILKTVTVLLLLAMTVRHAEFYLFPQGMVHEMGWLQPRVGVFLIPVTAAFGFLIFWDRGFAWQIDTYEKCRFALIGSIPLWIALYQGQLLEAFRYSYLDPSRRPPFLILLPIALSILSISVSAGFRWVVLFACVAGAIFWQNFIAYYVALFLLFGFSQGQHWFRQLIGSWLTVPLYVGVLISIFELQIERINMPMEFIFASAFLGAAFFVTSQFTSSAIRVARWRWVAECGTLYFYIAQGLLFTGFKVLKLTERSWAIAFVVFIVALFIGYGAKRWDKKFELWVYQKMPSRWT